jgi:predicted LPLAT superfamily acyltransferase
MTENSLVRDQDWAVHPERGSITLIKIGVWVALRLGRRGARLFLYPICLYFLILSVTASRSSQQYLARALGRPARFFDVFRHYLTFASCVLDRVFLLNDQSEQFEIRIHGEKIVREIKQRGGGCILFGAHFGSFEVARAVGRRLPDFPISLLMYEANAQKIRTALAAINPKLDADVIGLGRLDSLITVAERLQRGHFVGVLADRNFNGKDMVRLPFLGMPAAFPQGPFRLAMLLQQPIVMMFGVYCGSKTYDVYFEKLVEASASRPVDKALWLDNTMRHYVERLEHHCRNAPFNWFNFYDFWK